MGSQNDHPPEEGPTLPSVLSASFRSSPIAEEVIARDVAACSDDDASESSHAAPEPALYRRPSGVAYGTVRPTVNDLSADAGVLTSGERARSRDAERALLRDNHILPPEGKSRWRGRDGGAHGVEGRPDERSSLLAGPVRDDEEMDQRWSEAVAAGRVRTTWGREAKTISSYAGPLLLASLLQYSVNVVCIFAVGKIGKMELGAVSRTLPLSCRSAPDTHGKSTNTLAVASMTAVITCYGPFLGLATSLDTLCAQAYGSGHKHLVGLQFQRMAWLLLLCYIPIAILWWNGEAVLSRLVPDARSAELGGIYLRVLIVGGPFVAVFEAGKRFVQAQGLFHATTYVLLIAAPVNVFVTWLLVWKLELGFIGAPISVVFTEILMPTLLFLYVRFIDGYQCWGGFSWRAFNNWGESRQVPLGMCVGD